LESIFNGIPLPAIIVYKTSSGRRAAVFEVMDGKQRLESILHFRYRGIIPGEPKLGFGLRRDHSKLRKRLFYSDLSKAEIRAEHGVSVRTFTKYRVPVIEYSGELTGLAGQRIAQKEIFAKINSTGSKLTKNEIRHANATALFHTASRLEGRWYRRIVDNWRVFSKAEADRYQYHEMLMELCTVHLHGGISDRRLRLDEFMRLDSLTKSRLSKAEKAVNQAIQWARSILTDDGIRYSRLSKKADFYSFVGTLMELLRQRTLTTGHQANRKARKAVKGALAKLAKVDGRVARYTFRRLPLREQKLAGYIVATREATDQLRNRQTRHDFWYEILTPCFPKKLAARRLFGKDLKNALWNAAKVQYGRLSCPNPNRHDDCWGRITYEQAVVDHRRAYAKGGSSTLENAQLLCVACNSSKGAK
jgi:5-methylcytosine-specific restriction endonuclease McrA